MLSAAVLHLAVAAPCRAPGWSTLVRDDAEVLTNMQSYLRTLLLEEVNTSGPQPQPASESSESMGAAASTAVDRGWSLPQRLLVRLMA